MQTDPIVTELPEYVDITTPAVQWYGYNLLIFLLSIGMVVLAIFLLEHEIARLSNPLASFIATPMVFDIIIGTIVLLLGLANLSVLLFVLLRHLWIRPWMIATTLIGWMLLSVVVLVLQDRFLPVILPNMPL